MKELKGKYFVGNFNLLFCRYIVFIVAIFCTYINAFVHNCWSVLSSEIS